MESYIERIEFLRHIESDEYISLIIKECLKKQNLSLSNLLQLSEDEKKAVLNKIKRNTKIKNIRNEDK